MTVSLERPPVQGVSAVPPENSPHKKPWYRPTFSPEHGVLLVLLGAVLTGASVAQAWTADTSWACLAAFFGLQSEHPLIVQVKQRRRWRPRYLVWASVYGGLALLIGLWLTFRHPVLLWVLAAGVIALGLDVLAVFQRTHKAIANEIVMFSAICLSTLFIYGATADTLTVRALGMWILNSLFFSSAVFSVKLRKKKTSSLQPGIFYHAVAIVLVASLYAIGWLSVFTALVFLVAVLKLAVIMCWQDWYRNCCFEHVARFETYFALSYTFLAALTVLPPKLPPAA
ncbi:MAG: YwiC-like family protein [Cyanobacteria bacterium P01_D01_bin.105]